MYYGYKNAHKDHTNKKPKKKNIIYVVVVNKKFV